MAGNIFLIGFMGTGKTTVSRQLSNMLNFLEMDMDQEIENRKKMKISAIFEAYGEEYFRNMETSLIQEFEKKSDFVVSCGGGAVLRQENVENMKKNGIVVLLTAEPETIYQRVRFSKNRPLLNGNMNVAYISEMMESRVGFYRNAADITVGTDGKRPEKIAAEIVENIKKLKNPKFSFAF